MGASSGRTKLRYSPNCMDCFCMRTNSLRPDKLTVARNELLVERALNGEGFKSVFKLHPLEREVFGRYDLFSAL